MGTHARSADVVRAVVAIVGSSSTIQYIRVRACADSVTNIVGTLISVIRAHSATRRIIHQTGARPVTRVGAGTVPDSLITTRRAHWQIRMRTRPRPVTSVGRAVVSVIRARGAGRLIICLARARTVTGIRIGAITINWISAGRTGRRDPMGTNTVGANVLCAFVPLVRARRLVWDPRMGT